LLKILRESKVFTNFRVYVIIISKEAVNTMDDKKYTFEDFMGIMRRLIAPDGCPWDRVQTHESLKRYLIEECYEVVDAIDNKDKENLCEELGDVMLQVVFHSILAEQENYFDIGDVINGVSQKMINRHRHIFGDVVANTPEDVLKSWEEIKKEEKGYKSRIEQLKSVPKSLPALMRAEKVAGKMEKLGYEGDDLEKLCNDAEELISQLKTAETMTNEAKMDNIGKILLVIANISSKIKINPEFALTNAVETVINRLEYVENTNDILLVSDEDTQQ
jgi:tetrapyrrole methylase family protein/MazG family protein